MANHFPERLIAGINRFASTRLIEWLQSSRRFAVTQGHNQVTIQLMMADLIAKDDFDWFKAFYCDMVPDRLDGGPLDQLFIDLSEASCGYHPSDVHAVCYANEVIGLLGNLIEQSLPADDRHFKAISCLDFLHACLALKQHPAIAPLYRRYALDLKGLQVLLSCYALREPGEAVSLTQWLFRYLRARGASSEIMQSFASHGASYSLVMNFLTVIESKVEASNMTLECHDWLKSFSSQSFVDRLISEVVSDGMIDSPLFEFDCKICHKLTAQDWLYSLLKAWQDVRTESALMALTKAMTWLCAHLVSLIDKCLSLKSTLVEMPDCLDLLTQLKQSVLKAQQALPKIIPEEVDAFVADLMVSLNGLQRLVVMNEHLHVVWGAQGFVSKWFMDDDRQTVNVVLSFRVKPCVEYDEPISHEQGGLACFSPYSLCLAKRLDECAPEESQDDLLTMLFVELYHQFDRVMNEGMDSPFEWDVFLKQSKYIHDLHLPELYALLMSQEGYRELRDAYRSLREKLLGEWLDYWYAMLEADGLANVRTAFYHHLAHIVACQALPEDRVDPAWRHEDQMIDGVRPSLRDLIDGVQLLPWLAGRAKDVLLMSLLRWIEADHPEWYQALSVMALPSSEDLQSCPLAALRFAHYRITKSIVLQCDSPVDDPVLSFVVQLSTLRPEFFLYCVVKSKSKDALSILTVWSNDLARAWMGMPNVKLLGRQIPGHLRFEIESKEVHVMDLRMRDADAVLHSAFVTYSVKGGCYGRHADIDELPIFRQYEMMVQSMQEQYHRCQWLPHQAYHLPRADLFGCCQALCLRMRKWSLAKKNIAIYEAGVLAWVVKLFGEYTAHPILAGMWYPLLIHVLVYPDTSMPYVDHMGELLGMICEQYWLNTPGASDKDFSQMEPKILFRMAKTNDLNRLEQKPGSEFIDMLSFFDDLQREPPTTHRRLSGQEKKWLAKSRARDMFPSVMLALKKAHGDLSRHAVMPVSPCCHPHESGDPVI